MDDDRRIEDLYPNVDYVRVGYTLRFAGHSIVKRDSIVRGDSLYEKCCVIRCPNRDCTSEGFDLSSDVHTAIIRNEIVTGKKECTGKISSKYIGNSNQLCDGSIEYSISSVLLSP
jgi:hypothetical protein